MSDAADIQPATDVTGSVACKRLQLALQLGYLGCMDRFLFALKKRVPDILFIGLPAAGALACWYYQLPAWMLFICLVGLFFGLISLLGDLGVFGGRPKD